MTLFYLACSPEHKRMTQCKLTLLLLSTPLLNPMAKKVDEGCSYDAWKASQHFSTRTFPDTIFISH